MWARDTVATTILASHMVAKTAQRGLDSNSGCLIEERGRFGQLGVCYWSLMKGIFGGHLIVLLFSRRVFIKSRICLSTSSYSERRKSILDQVSCGLLISPLKWIADQLDPESFWQADGLQQRGVNLESSLSVRLQIIGGLLGSRVQGQSPSQAAAAGPLQWLSASLHLSWLPVTTHVNTNQSKYRSSGKQY